MTLLDSKSGKEVNCVISYEWECERKLGRGKKMFAVIFILFYYQCVVSICMTLSKDSNGGNEVNNDLVLFCLACFTIVDTDFLLYCGSIS